MSKNSPYHQLTLELPHRTAMDRDDFLVAGSNEQAVRHIDDWPQWPHPVLILVGPKGSGKSHLAHVWQQMSGAQYIQAPEFDHISEPLPLTGRAVIIEDIGLKLQNETGLFHLINLARENGGHILLTSAHFPSSWSIDLPDLASRLRAATVAELKEPDDHLLRAILVKLFSDRQVRVDEKTIQYLLSRMERSVDFARKAVHAIDSQALSSKSKITRALVSEVLEKIQ